MKKTTRMPDLNDDYFIDYRNKDKYGQHRKRRKHSKEAVILPQDIYFETENEEENSEEKQ